MGRVVCFFEVFEFGFGCYLVVFFVDNRFFGFVISCGVVLDLLLCLFYSFWLLVWVWMEYIKVNCVDGNFVVKVIVVFVSVGLVIRILG